MINIKRNKATAIITTILIVAVVSIAAITMQGYLHGELNRTQMILDSDNMLNALYDIEAWGISSINSKDFDSSNDLSAKKVNMNLSGKIVAQNGLFNLNFLYSLQVCRKNEPSDEDQLFMTVFKNLIKHNVSDTISLADSDVEILINNIQIAMCASSSVSFIEVALKENSKNLTDKNWEYQKSGQLFTDKSELKLVPGITNEIYQSILPVVTTLPVEVKNGKVQAVINAAEISPSLFSALADLSISEANDFLDSQNSEDKKKLASEVASFIDKQKIYGETQAKVINKILSNEQDVNYYIISGKVELYDYLMQMHTLVIKRKDLKVLWRNRGFTYG